MQVTRLPLLWRVFTINAALLLAGTLALVFLHGRIDFSFAVLEVLDVVVILGAMLAGNLLLLRPTLGPIDRLVERMRTVDLLRPGQRLPEQGGVEAVAIVRAFNQMLDRLEQERRDSGRRAIEAQEGERLRISRGLHDEVGQVLTGVLLQLDALEDANPDARRRRTAETRQTVRQALEEVRRIAQELRPQPLEHLGLVSALIELSRRFADQSGLAVERRFAADLPRVSLDGELAIYRVAQESLTNVARHAQAGRVVLTLQPGAGSVILHVSDDGRGMSEAAAENGRGGLRGMREHALLVGGVLAIAPGRGGGVDVRLEVPAERP
ncbi:MAG TPA: histidine kinase [Gaiellaceae bacterium]|jgi:two-component system sensor histidine kinase UhpB|nr:histidine kinase [Gaiellaceae bacterium]